MWDEDYQGRDIPTPIGHVPNGLLNGRGNVTLEICFTEWGDLQKYIDEVKRSFPDKEWFAKYRDYLKGVVRGKMEEYIDKLSDDAVAFLPGKESKWCKEHTRHYFYDNYEVTEFGRRPRIDYGFQNEKDESLFVCYNVDDKVEKPINAKLSEKKDNFETDVRYTCKCGLSFKDEKEYQKHVSENVVEVYKLILDKENYNSDVVCFSPIKMKVIKSTLSKCIKKTKKGEERPWTFSDNEKYAGCSLDDMFEKVFTRKWGENGWDGFEQKDNNDFVNGDVSEVFVFFKDPSELASKYKWLYDKFYRSLLMSQVDKAIKERLKKIDSIKRSIDKGFDFLVSEIDKDFDEIGKYVRDMRSLSVTLKNGDVNLFTQMLIGEDKDDEQRELTLFLGKQNQRGIASFMLGEDEKKQKEEEEKRKKELRKSYNKSDKFIMEVYDLWWADEMSFPSKEVITGSQRVALEEIASRKGAKCYLSFGTNEDGEYTDLLESAIRFIPISDEDAKTLKRLKMDKVGNVSYSQIMDGFKQKNEEDED